MEQDLKTDPPCHARACAIQGTRCRFVHGSAAIKASIDCLTKSNYNEDKCQAQIDALYDCCDAFYSRHGEGAKTVSCPKVSLLKY